MIPEHPAAPKPEWLRKASAPLGPLPLGELLAGSVYYPACGFDWEPIRLLSGNFHTFVYADYGITPEALRLQLGGFDGYSPFATREVATRELAPEGWPPLHQAAVDQISHFPDWLHHEVFARWAVLERSPALGRDHGPERFSLLYIRGEGVATFRGLYQGNRAVPAVVSVIQPGTNFGGNWTDFEDPTRVFAMSVLGNRAGVPPYLLHGGQGAPGSYQKPCWPGYGDHVADLTPTLRLWKTSANPPRPDLASTGEAGMAPRWNPRSRRSAIREPGTPITSRQIQGHSQSNPDEGRMPSVTDRTRGILLGLAAGDRNGGPTQMALRLAESVAQRRGYDPANVLARYLDWWRDGAFDTGPVAAGVLARIAAGVPHPEAVRLVHEAHGGMTAGCNPAHRCPPLAMTAAIDDEDIAACAAHEAGLTHLHPLAGDVAAAVAVLCRTLVRGLDWEEALDRARAGRSSETAYALLIDTSRPLDPGGFSPEVLRAAVHFVGHAMTFDKALDGSIQFAGAANYAPVLVGAIGGARWGASSISPVMLGHCLDILDRLEAVAERLSWG